jgi:hypothetical protein
MLFMQIIAIYFGNHMETRNTMSEQNAVSDVTAGSTCSGSVKFFLYCISLKNHTYISYKLQ